MILAKRHESRLAGLRPPQREQPSERTLTKRIAASTALLVSSKVMTKLIDLTALLLLARLLTPADFGVVAIAVTTTVLVDTVLEVPIASALVRLPVLTRDHLDTAFTLGLIRGLILMVAMLVISVFTADFYGEPRLLPLTLLMSLGGAMRGLQSPRMAEYAKNLSFVRDVSLEVIAKAIACLVAVLVAWTTHSYWALMIFSVLSPTVATAGSYIVAAHRPALSLGKSREFIGFFGWSSGAQIVGAIVWNLDRLLLAKILAPSLLGRFAMAADLANLPMQALLQPMSRPLFASFVMLRNDPERLQRAYTSSIASVVTIGLPLIVLVHTFAGPMLPLVLGQQWRGTARILELLILTTIPMFYTAFFQSLTFALEKPKVYFQGTIVYAAFSIPVIVAGGLIGGIYGIVLARGITQFFWLLVQMVLVRRLIGTSFAGQIALTWRCLVGALAMAATLWFCVGNTPATDSYVYSLLRVVAFSAVGLAVYAGCCLTTWNFTGRPAGLEAKAMDYLFGLKCR